MKQRFAHQMKIEKAYFSLDFIGQKVKFLCCQLSFLPLMLGAEVTVEIACIRHHKIQLSLHSHESNAKGRLAEYIDEVMHFSTLAAEKGTCMVLRLWNQGGRDKENEEVMRLIEHYVPKPWKTKPIASLFL